MVGLHFSQESSQQNTCDMHLQPVLNNLYIFSLLANQTNSFNSEIHLVTGIRKILTPHHQAIS